MRPPRLASKRCAGESAAGRATLATDRTLATSASHDVLAIAERDDLSGRSDRTIFDVAASEDRAVITNNIKDFRPLAAEWLAQGRTHAGLILLPAARLRTRAAIPLLADAIAKVLHANPDGIAGSERWIGPLTNT